VSSPRILCRACRTRGNSASGQGLGGWFLYCRGYMVHSRVPNEHVSCYLRSYHQLASQPTGYFSGREGSSIPCVAISRISRLGSPCYRMDVDAKRQIGETQKRGQAPIYKSILLPTDRIMMMLSAEGVYYRIYQKCTPSLLWGFCGL
jgi:hypothetical protein